MPRLSEEGVVARRWIASYSACLEGRCMRSIFGSGTPREVPNDKLTAPIGAVTSRLPRFQRLYRQQYQKKPGSRYGI